MDNKSNKMNILVIAPHPDDESTYKLFY